MANPRIDELRKRLEREPGSRLFAQLAEELRKDGDLADAIRVARAGLQVHPSYPSARMTLGRALFDTRDLAAARLEFEGVLRGAPDNILASRMLGECLEGLGDLGAALLQFRAALRLAPNDRQIEGNIRSLEQRLAGGGAPLREAATVRALAGPEPSSVPPVAHPAGPPVTPPAAALTLRPPPQSALPPPLPPNPAVPPPPAPPSAQGAGARSTDAAAGDFDDVFEATPSWQRPVASSLASGPVVLLDEDEAPTLPGSPPLPPAAPTRPAEGPLPGASPSNPEQQASPVTMAFEAPPLRVLPAPLPAVELEKPNASTDTLTGAPAFEVAPPAPILEGAESPRSTTTAAFAAFVPPGPELVPPDPVGSDPERSRVAAPPLALPDAPAPAPEAGPAHLASTTLAELYVGQGFLANAVEVYEQLLEKDPKNERARARLIEVKARLQGQPPEAGPAAPPAGAKGAPVEMPPVPPPDERALRRRVLERTIARLEHMLAATRRA